MNKYNKKILWTLKILLFIAGFTVGFLAIWQTLYYRPGLVKGGLVYVFYAVCGLVPGTVLFLSAKPFYLALRVAGRRVMSRLNGISGEDAAGVVLCIVFALIAGYLSDILFGLFIPVAALRFILDFFAGFAVFYFSFVLFFRLAHGPAKGLPPEPERAAVFFDGYVITSEALKSAAALELVERWLSGRVYAVRTSILTAVPDGALPEKIAALLQSGRVEAVPVDDESEPSAVAAFIGEAAYKIIASTDADAERFNNCGAEILVVERLITLNDE